MENQTILSKESIKQTLVDNREDPTEIRGQTDRLVRVLRPRNSNRRKRH